MGGNGNQEVDASSLDVQTALEIARNSEGAVDIVVRDFLDQKWLEVWRALESDPDSYVLNKDEFAVFNFFRNRSLSSPLAQSAIRRFWDNYPGAPTAASPE
jgi:hypothetical protein